MTPEECQKVKEHMTKHGWTCDCDDEKRLGNWVKHKEEPKIYVDLVYPI